MARYRVIYNKSGFPLIAWKESRSEAQHLANMLRKTGYSVDVWIHTIDGARKVNL